MFKGERLNKKQITSIICMVILFSGIFGWLYEVAFYYLSSGFKQMYIRGGYFLPFIDLYIYGGLLVLFLTYKRRKHPLQVFLISVISTGILEYIAGFILYGVLNLRHVWNYSWDYNQELWSYGNIGSYVCLRSVIFFGLSGLFLIYVMIPLLIKLVKNKKTKNIIYIIGIVGVSLFAIDLVYNLFIANIFNLPTASSIYKSLGFKYLYF